MPLIPRSPLPLSNQGKSDSVLCTCQFKCGALTYKDKTTNQTYHGQFIKMKTRADHRRRDREAGHGQADLGNGPSVGLGVDREQEGKGRKTKDMEKQATEIAVGREPRDGSHSQQVEYEEVTDLGNEIRASVSALGSWLYLVGGLSRAYVNRSLSAVRIIVSMAIKFGKLSERFKQQWPEHANDIYSAPPLPCDVRTAMKTLSLEPELRRTICCPKCFKQYHLDDVPELCNFRATPKSRVCKEALYTIRSTSAGPLRVPCRLYNVQDFESWLEYFLSVPGIEEKIDKSYAHKPNSTVMASIWDSPAWRSLGSFTTTRGNLTFSYFIDWFNPLSNKIAGKTVSAGAIMFFCLNLPPELQYLPEYTYFAAITPLPKEPNMETITAVSDPVISQVERMFSGRVLRSYCHPEGCLWRVGILPAIGDLLAMRKALGFAGVGSLAHFCSFCLLHKRDIEETDVQMFTPRNGTNVRAASEQWRTSTTKKARNEIFKAHGVRWSSLNVLSYRDPVKHTVLGLMHNWIEGVLQHQVRHRWGIGKDIEKREKVSETVKEDIVMGSDSDVDSDSDIDMMDIDDELVELGKENSTITNSISLDNTLVDTHSSGDASSWLFNITLSNEMDDEDYSPDLEDDEADNFEDDTDEDSSSSSLNDDGHGANGAGVLTFTPVQLELIRNCLRDATIPSWVERPPPNLGEKTHGKLKADQWHKLFIVFLPLILPEVWTALDSNLSHSLLINFYNLVVCTNIVCAYTVSNDAADLYLHHYIQYRTSAQSLFPHAPSRPNHHYAMHNTELMKFWGPLIRLSEFPYERHNGTLQKIKTNGHLWEMDLTMLRQICRRSRITTLLERGHLAENVRRAASDELINPVGISLAVSEALSNTAEKIRSPAKPQRLSDKEYNSWLIYLNRQDPKSEEPSFRHRNNFLDTTIDFPEDGVLSPWAASHQHILYQTRPYSVYSMHPGNSSISFSSHDGTVGAGFIQKIWSCAVIPGEAHQTYLLVAPHSRLSNRDEEKNPYRSLPGLKADIVYAQKPKSDTWIVIGTVNILGHIAFYSRPKGTFGIAKSTLVIVNSLHRDIL